MHRMLTTIVVIVCLAICTQALANEATSVEARLMAITDIVLQHHIDPPTRQQMILSGVKALYAAQELAPPTGLSRRISELAEKDQITNYLVDTLKRFDELEDAESRMTGGMLRAVPGGAFLMAAKENNIQSQVAANRYVGTGIALAIAQDAKQPAIPRVFHDGPAWRAGAKANDLILEIDGEAMAGKELNYVVEKLRGEEGSEVTVVVRQPESDETRTLQITRGRVFIPSVEGYQRSPDGQWQYTSAPADDIAVLRIKSIGPSTLHELRQVETQLRREEIRGIVLDLRHGGGTLHDLVLVADALLDGGVIGHVRTVEGVETFEARPGALFAGVPMAVLIGGYVGTDRVLLTAALQDHGRAVVVGQRTTGETYVNQFLPMPNRDERIRLAVGIPQRGNGTPLLSTTRQPNPTVHVVAEPAQPGPPPRYIQPDHVVSLHPPAVSEATSHAEHDETDPTLAKAIEVLRDSQSHARSGREPKDVSG